LPIQEWPDKEMEDGVNHLPLIVGKKKAQGQPKTFSTIRPSGFISPKKKSLFEFPRISFLKIPNAM
jgi:hypothetical protein|tara:strand:- start:86 stop:283 length:198 start_codon:yes stop_codon:yes gene_type:complete